MGMITITVVDGLYFAARVPCGQSWPGMRHTNDVRIVIDRAMDHAASCEACTPEVPTTRAADRPTHGRTAPPRAPGGNRT